MPVTSTPALVQNPKKGLVQIVSADGTNQKTVRAAGANGTKVTSLMAASDDSAQRLLQISVLRGGTNYVLGTVPVPANAGTDGAVPTANLLDITKLVGLAVDNDGQPYLFLESGDTLQVKATTAVTAAKTIHVHSDQGDF